MKVGKVLLKIMRNKIMMLLQKLKKWNWTIFVVILLVACMGALENKSISNFAEGIILVLGFGVPIGLVWAWLTKSE